MKPYIPLTFVFCWCFATLTVQAQNNTEKTVNDATQALGSIKGLFGKKKAADKKDAMTAKTNSPTNNQSASTKSQKSVSKGSAVILAGTIAPDAKVIDCDEMQPFSLGAAVIKKGSSFALIDTAGNFIVPWNKYSNISTTGDNSRPGGIFIVRSTETYPKSYYMNNKGKIMGPTDYGDFRISVRVSGKYIIIYTGITPNVTNTIIDKDGVRHVIHTAMAGSMNDSTFVYQETGKDGYSVMGLKDLNGNNLTKAIFTTINPFYNGVAIVELKDEFGQTRSGAINAKGKFTIAPTLNIHGIPRYLGDIIAIPGGGNSDYDVEYFNIRTGKMIFKETKETEARYGKFSIIGSNYPSTMLSKDNTKYILDSDGNIVKDADILNKLGIKFGPSEKYERGYYKYDIAGSPDIIAFSLDLHLTEVTMHQSDVCYYNLKTKKYFVLPGWSSNNMMFDPVAHLTYMSIPTFKSDNVGAQITIDGYMNADGVFKIIKGRSE